MIGKLLGKVIAAPITIPAEMLKIAEDAVESAEKGIACAFDGDESERR